MFFSEYLSLIKTKFIGLFFPWISMTYAIVINIGICMWKHMGQHICFGAMCDIVANSHINVIKATFTQKHWLHAHNMSYRTYRLCSFITFLAFKSSSVTNNHIGLLIAHLIINVFLFFLRLEFLKYFMLYVTSQFISINSMQIDNH